MLNACIIALFVNAILQRRTTENNEVLYQVLACNPTGISYNKTWWCVAPTTFPKAMFTSSFFCVHQRTLSYFFPSGRLLFLYISTEEQHALTTFTSHIEYQYSRCEHKPHLGGNNSDVSEITCYTLNIEWLRTLYNKSHIDVSVLLTTSRSLLRKRGFDTSFYRFKSIELERRGVKFVHKANAIGSVFLSFFGTIKNNQLTFLLPLFQRWNDYRVM